MCVASRSAMESRYDSNEFGSRKETRRGNRRSTFNQSIYTGERDRLKQAIKIILQKSSTAIDSQFGGGQSQGGGGIQGQGGSATPRQLSESQDTEEGGSAYVQALMDLQPAFTAQVEKNDTGSMDKDTFVQACQRVKALAAKMRDLEMGHLFMKIDVDRVGSVDWDKFTSFILTQQLAREGLPGTNSSTFVKVSRASGMSSELEAHESGNGGGGGGRNKGVSVSIGSIDSFGRPGNFMERICFVRNLDSYVTATQVGNLKVWQGEQLQPMRSIQNGNSAWVTDLVCMDQQPLAAFALDRSVTFYDTARISLDVLGRIERLDNAPMCATWLRVAENDKLLYGDDLGNIHTFSFSDEWGGESLQEGMTATSDLLPGMLELPLWSVHSDWVTRIVYMPHAVSLLTASMDNRLLLLDLEKRQTKWTAVEHQNGILGCSYCRSYNFIVTCGLERHVNIWNPFTAKTMGRLEGHQSSVLDVAVNEKDNQIVSVGADNEVKVWDMRSNRCLQTIARPALHSCNKYAILYENSQDSLLIGAESLELWQKRPAREARVSRTCAVLYSPKLRQVVVGDESFLVSVWSLDSGLDVFSFSDRHRDTKISAMCFDVSERRLLIGGQDGTLRMWNYNNGQCLKDFRGFGKDEVSGVSCLEEGRVQYAAAVGWHGKVSIWVESGKEHEALDHAMVGHSDDVVCLTFCAPHTLATAGFDGKILLWKFDGTIKSILRSPPPPKDGDGSSGPTTILSLLYLPQMDKALISAIANGYVHFWRISEATLTHQICTGHQSPLGPLCVDTTERLMFTSEKKGFVKAWDLQPCNLKQKPPAGSSDIAQVLHFRAHHDKIVSMAFIQSERLLLTASYSGNTRLWTTNGVKIGEFGQLTPWTLTLPQLSEAELKRLEAAKLLDIGKKKPQAEPGADQVDDDGVGISDQQMHMALVAAGLYHPPQTPVRLEDKVRGILAIGPPHYRLRPWYDPMAVPVHFTIPTKDFSRILPVVPLYLSPPSNDKFVKLVNDRNARPAKKMHKLNRV